jgi:phenylacetate-CoA ligase
MPPTYDPRYLGPAPRPHDQRHWDPEMQTMPREQLEALQVERLRELATRMLAGQAPLFGRKLAEAGITDPNEITSVSDLNRVPLTRKQELRDSEAAHPPFGDYRFAPLDQCVRLGTSTGTTGTPTVALWTRRDMWVEYESGARNWWRSGWRPGQIVTHAHPAYLYGGGPMLSGSLEYFGMLDIWVPPPDTDEAAEQGIRFWQRVHPDVSMVAFNLGRFVEVAAKLGLDLTEDCGLPSFQLHGFGAKGLPLMTCGAEAYAYAGGPGPECSGGHVHEDWAVVQAVDPDTGADVPEGRWGNLVVTTLDRDNAMVRYDLEEAVCIFTDPCPCGETTKRAFWGGRFKDYLSVQGHYFHVNEVEQALRGVEAITTPTLEYAVVRPVDDAAALRVRVELADGDPAVVRSEVADAISRAIGVKADIEVLPRESLARSGYKAQRLVEG